MLSKSTELLQWRFGLVHASIFRKYASFALFTKCKHKLCYTVSSTAYKQVPTPTSVPRKRGSDSWGRLQTQAVISESIRPSMPCQGAGSPAAELLGTEGAGPAGRVSPRRAVPLARTPASLPWVQLREPRHSPETWLSTGEGQQHHSLSLKPAEQTGEPMHSWGKLSICTATFQTTATYCCWSRGTGRRRGTFGALLSWLWCPRLTPANAPLGPPALQHTGPDAWCRRHPVPPARFLHGASPPTPAPPRRLWLFCLTTGLGKEGKEHRSHENNHLV